MWRADVKGYGKWQNCISGISKSSDDCGEEIPNVRNTAAVNITSTVKRFLYLEISL